MKTLRYYRLIIALGLIFATLGVPLVAQAQNPTIVFLDDFTDGELDNNPTWTYSNTAWSIINGQLHHDGAITDGSGRYRTIFDSTINEIIQPLDYLEMSYYGYLKSVGNPQIGTGIELHLVGQGGAYMLRLQKGATSGANVNFFSFALSYTTPNGWVDLIVSNFEPTYDQGYVIKAIRQNGIWTLYVDSQVIGSAADPLQITTYNRFFNDVIGSVIIDDVTLKTLPANSLDTTPPTITWVGDIDDVDNFYFGFVPAAPTCTADDPSGVDGPCTVTGYASTLGAHTLTARAQDTVGNVATETRNYTVIPWMLTGFYQPVDMNGVYNLVKNGSTVPLKFEVFAGSTELTDVTDIKSLTYAQTSCNANAITDEIETLATGSTSLRYDVASGQFIYNWKTPKTAGLCYRMTLTTLDSSTLVAYFKLK